MSRTALTTLLLFYLTIEGNKNKYVKLLPCINLFHLTGIISLKDPVLFKCSIAKAISIESKAMGFKENNLGFLH